MTSTVNPEADIAGLLRRSTELRLQRAGTVNAQADAELVRAVRAIVRSTISSLGYTGSVPVATSHVTVVGNYRRWMSLCVQRVVDAFGIVVSTRDLSRDGRDDVVLRGYRPDVNAVADFGQTVAGQLELVVNRWWLQHPQQGSAPLLDAYRLRREFVRERTDRLVNMVSFNVTDTNGFYDAGRFAARLLRIRNASGR